MEHVDLVVHNRRWSLALALFLAAVLAAISVSPALAIVVIKSDGPNGNYFVTDSSSEPGAKCGYGPEDPSGFASLSWIRFAAPQVYARDITPDVDTQKLQLKYFLQRRVDSGRWKTVRSATQTLKGYDDHAAGFKSMKLFATGRTGDLFRAVVRINWMRGGAVEGWVKYRVQFYSVKWTVGDPAYVYQDACDGRAD